MAVDPVNTAYQLNIPYKESIRSRLEQTSDSELAKEVFEAFLSIEDWVRQGLADGLFGRRNVIQYQQEWSHFGPLYTRSSPEFFTPEDYELVEVVCHLTTPASVTGPQIRVYNDAATITTVSMTTNATVTASGLSSSFIADSDELKFEIISVGDGTARNLVCYARFQ